MKILGEEVQRRFLARGGKTWAGKGFWAVVDQGLFAGTNFLVSVLLARWLEPEAYGAFSVAYAVFSLAGTFHTALWTEPMLVYGSSRFQETFGAYQRVLLRYHWRFGLILLVFCLLIAASFGLLGQEDMSQSFLGLALAGPVVLYLWLVRRCAYACLDPRLAAYGGALYLTTYLLATYLVFWVGALNEVTAFLAMALAALLAAEWIRRLLGNGAEQKVNPEEVKALHWAYGRWALLAGAFSWIPGNIYYVVLPSFNGLEAAGQFKALLNLLMPILHFNGALGQLLVPGMVRARVRGHLAQFVIVSMVALLGFAVLYWLLLAATGKELMNWLYGGKFVEAAEWIIWLGLLPVLTAVTTVTSNLLRASENTRTLALVYAGLAGFAATAGVALAWMQGLGGAVWALLMVNALSAVAFGWLTKSRW